MLNSQTNIYSRTKLFVIVLICILPILCSYFFYFAVKPKGGKSYGHLLEVKTVANLPVRNLQGQEMTLAHLQGKWLLMMVAGGGCDSACQDRLFAIRQYRAGQGIEADRIKRVWIVDDDAPLNIHLSPHLLEGVSILRLQKHVFDLPSLHHAILLIDPQSNQVMQYRLGQDHRKIMNEIAKILKNNQGLG